MPELQYFNLDSLKKSLVALKESMWSHCELLIAIAGLSVPEKNVIKLFKTLIESIKWKIWRCTLYDMCYLFIIMLGKCCKLEQI